MSRPKELEGRFFLCEVIRSTGTAIVEICGTI